MDSARFKQWEALLMTVPEGARMEFFFGLDSLLSKLAYEVDISQKILDEHRAAYNELYDEAVALVEQYKRTSFRQSP